MRGSRHIKVAGGTPTDGGRRAVFRSNFSDAVVEAVRNVNVRGVIDRNAPREIKLSACCRTAISRKTSDKEISFNRVEYGIAGACYDASDAIGCDLAYSMAVAISDIEVSSAV
jgi:hypothetical protein